MRGEAHGFGARGRRELSKETEECLQSSPTPKHVLCSGERDASRKQHRMLRGTGHEACTRTILLSLSLQVSTGGETVSLFSTYSLMTEIYFLPTDVQPDMLKSSNIKIVPVLLPMGRERTRGEQGFKCA